MYKTGHAFTYLLLKECVVVCLLRTTPSTSGGVICQPVSMLKADSLNITYDCYSQNNNVKTAAL